MLSGVVVLLSGVVVLLSGVVVMLSGVVVMLSGVVVMLSGVVVMLSGVEAYFPTSSTARREALLRPCPLRLTCHLKYLYISVHLSINARLGRTGPDPLDLIAPQVGLFVHFPRHQGNFFLLRFIPGSLPTPGSLLNLQF
jgi:hypothetical protein